MHAPVNNSPGDLAGVLALQEEGGIFRAGESEDLVGIGLSSLALGDWGTVAYLAIASNEQLTLAGVDTVAGEGVDLEFLGLMSGFRTILGHRMGIERTIYISKPGS